MSGESYGHRQRAASITFFPAKEAFPDTRPVIPAALALGTVAGPSVAQQAPKPAPRDTARRDSVAILPTISVTRSPETLQTVPIAADILDKKAIRRGQPTLGLDEALHNLPGVYVANRYNFSQDQRLSIRWADGSGTEAEATAFAFWRDLGSPLATPPPGARRPRSVRTCSVRATSATTVAPSPACRSSRTCWCSART